jgi:hypothetical protein
VVKSVMVCLAALALNCPTAYGTKHSPIHSVCLLALERNMSRLEVASLLERATASLQADAKWTISALNEEQILKSPESIPNCDAVLVIKRGQQDTTNYATKQTYSYDVVTLSGFDGQRFKENPARTLGEKPFWSKSNWSGKIDGLIRNFSKAMAN